MMRRLALFLLVPLLAFTWSYGQRTTQQPVEQQTPGGATEPDRSLWVVNPRPAPNGCAWDADDQMDARAIDQRLAPGESTEWRECLFADWVAHVFQVQVYAKNGDLRVQVGWTNADGSRSYVVPGNFGERGRAMRYDACFAGPEYDHGSPLLPPVENSNGGVAQPTDLFVRITNVGGRTARGVSVTTSVHLPINEWCPNPLVREYIIPAQLWWFK